ncbi:MAG: sulfotransferase family protein [Gammaproteobacteria bacterium]
MTTWQPAPRSELAQMLYTQAAAKARFTAISSQQVIDSAVKKTGLSDFGSDDGWRSRLDVLVDSINREARLNPLGLASSGLGMPVDMLRGRLELQDALKTHPEVFETKIERPIFIVGGSRTGTTLLQRLLGSDLRLRTPLLWQMSSTRTFAFGSDDERAMLRNRVDTGQKMLHMLNPTMKAVHYSEADGPEECVLMMGTDLRNLALMSCMNTPSYSALLAQEDFRESYVRHRQQLQLLDHRVRNERAEWGGAPPRWLLKAPYHLPCLEALAAAHPDAIIVHTHRDVVDTVTSTCSLYSVFRSTFSDAVDPLEVGRQQTAMLTDWFNGTVAARKRIEDARTRGENRVQFFDVHYRELTADPLAMAERILAFAGLETSDDSRAAMRRWLDDNRADKHGGHRYVPEEFGLDPRALREGMGPYREAFGVN